MWIDDLKVAGLMAALREYGTCCISPEAWVLGSGGQVPEGLADGRWLAADDDDQGSPDAGTSQ